MNTILAPRPARQVAHQSCGFCGAGRARPPAGATTATASAWAPTRVPSRL
jgi:hypothetical protein